MLMDIQTTFVSRRKWGNSMRRIVRPLNNCSSKQRPTWALRWYSNNSRHSDNNVTGKIDTLFDFAQYCIGDIWSPSLFVAIGLK